MRTRPHLYSGCDGRVNKAKISIACTLDIIYNEHMFLRREGVCTMVFKNSLWNDTGEIIVYSNYHKYCLKMVQIRLKCLL